MGTGFGRLACSEAAGRAACEEGDEGTEAGDAGADDAHGWFGGGPDGGVDVVPCVSVRRGMGLGMSVPTCDVNISESGEHN